MSLVPVQPPAGYVPVSALAYTLADGSAQYVAAATPLPVQPVTPAGSAPFSGTLAGAQTSAPYAPEPGRPVMLALSGSWTGQIQVTRSVDGGTTRLPLSLGGQPWAQFRGNCCEIVWEEVEPGAALYLESALTTGTANFRVSQ